MVLHCDYSRNARCCKTQLSIANLKKKKEKKERSVCEAAACHLFFQLLYLEVAPPLSLHAPLHRPAHLTHLSCIKIEWAALRFKDPPSAFIQRQTPDELSSFWCLLISVGICLNALMQESIHRCLFFTFSFHCSSHYWFHEEFNEYRRTYSTIKLLRVHQRRCTLHLFQRMSIF